MPLTPAAAHDLPAVAALVNGAYRGESAKAGWATEAEYITGDRITVPRLEADMADPAVHLLLLRGEDLEGEGPSPPLLGCVRLEERAAGEWALGMLTVRPDLQARGTGRRILQGAEAFVRARGGRAIRMGVISIREALIAWYGRRGYADTGAREPYTHGGEAMPLEFVVLERAL